MKTSIVFFTLLFGVIIIVTETSARPDHRLSESASYNEDREEDLSLTGQDRDYNRRERRRRHSRQIGKRYDYLSPWSYENTDYMILQKLNQFEQLSEDILKKYHQNSYSPQQPTVIMIPIYLPSECSQTSSSNSDKRFVPDFNNRIGGNINSEVPIWGYEQGDNAVEGDNDGARPISFKPVKVNRPQGIPLPPIEHGSVQAGVTTAAPSNTNTIPIREPGKCEAAILSCCRFTDFNQKECFKQYDCVLTYKTGLACTPDAIKAVILRFKEVYGPR